MPRIASTLLAFCLVAHAAPFASGAAYRTDVISAAAQSFLDSLDEAQRAMVVMPLGAKDRARWSNLPIVAVQPPGILLKDLNDEQRRAAHALMRATMSSQGYAKFAGIMLLDDVLHQTASQRLEEDEDFRKDPLAGEIVATRDSGNYAIAVFGEPGDASWAWKIAGHHAAANFTISEGRVAFTPTFLGSSPREIQSGRYAGWTALAHEGDRGIELMRSLDDSQRKTAMIADAAADDVFEGPGRRRSLESYEGVPAKDLTEDQMHRLRRLIFEHLHNVDHDAAHAQMAVIEAAGWAELWFSWRGPVDPDGRFYYRVHGPRLLIEYNRQDPNHDHMIVRDPANDYGEDWLGQHIEEHHPSAEEIRERMERRRQELREKAGEASVGTAPPR